MAEPLSLITTIASLLALGTKASLQLTQFIDSTRSASTEVHALSRELRELCILLGKLEGTFCNDAPPLGLSDDPRPVLESCMQIFTQLTLLLKDHCDETGDGVWVRGWKRVRWTLREKEVGGLRRQLEAHKMTLNIALVLATHTQNKDIIESSRMIESTMHHIKELLPSQIGLVLDQDSPTAVNPSREPPPAYNVIASEQAASSTMQKYLRRASFTLSSRSVSPVYPHPPLMESIDALLGQKLESATPAKGSTRKDEEGLNRAVQELRLSETQPGRQELGSGVQLSRIHTQRPSGPRPLLSSSVKIQPKDEVVGVHLLGRRRRTVSEQIRLTTTNAPTLLERSNTETLILKRPKRVFGERTRLKEATALKPPLDEPQAERRIVPKQRPLTASDILSLLGRGNTEAVSLKEPKETSVEKTQPKPSLQLPAMGIPVSESESPRIPPEPAPAIKSKKERKKPAPLSGKSKPERLHPRRARKGGRSDTRSEFRSGIVTDYVSSPDRIRPSTPSLEYASDAATYSPTRPPTPSLEYASDAATYNSTRPPTPSLEYASDAATYNSTRPPTPEPTLSTPEAPTFHNPNMLVLTISPSARLCTSCNLLVTPDDLIWGTGFLHCHCLLCDACSAPLNLTSGFFRRPTVEPLPSNTLGVYCVNDFLRIALPCCSKCRVRGVVDSTGWLDGKGRTWKERQFVAKNMVEREVPVLVKRGRRYWCKECGVMGRTEAL